MSPAIGEIGLDLHWVKDTTTYPAQRKVLEYFIAAAGEQNKFVNLHTKAGEKEILDLLEKYDVRRAIIHWYSGPMDVLKAMIDFGCYFTIGVEVLYSDYIKEIAKAVPDHLLLTETDNPGALKWLKKNDEIGMPVAIKSVVNALATLRQAKAEQIESVVQTISAGLSPTIRRSKAPMRYSAVNLKALALGALDAAWGFTARRRSG